MIHVGDEEFCSNTRKRSDLEEYQQFGFSGNYNANGQSVVSSPVNYRLYVIIICYLGEAGTESGGARTDVSLSDSELLATLDNTLTFSASTKQFVVNAVTVTQTLHWTESQDYF